MTRHQIENAFTYHTPTATQIPRYEGIREFAKDFALYLDNMCPESREKSLALTKLQECVMWANCAIAVNESEGKNGK